MPSKSNSTTVPKGYDFQEEVELDRVDSLVSPDMKIDFAIVDVHMMEIKALKGMKEIMERSPNLILMVDWKYYSNPNKNVK